MTAAVPPIPADYVDHALLDNLVNGRLYDLNGELYTLRHTGRSRPRRTEYVLAVRTLAERGMIDHEIAAHFSRPDRRIHAQAIFKLRINYGIPAGSGGRRRPSLAPIATR